MNIAVSHLNDIATNFILSKVINEDKNKFTAVEIDSEDSEYK